MKINVLLSGARWVWGM